MVTVWAIQTDIMPIAIRISYFNSNVCVEYGFSNLIAEKTYPIKDLCIIGILRISVQGPWRAGFLRDVYRLTLR